MFCHTEKLTDVETKEMGENIQKVDGSNIQWKRWNEWSMMTSM